ncbi:hypothetical protein QOZ80_5AG0389430 [Eleusine coracana subsp. coracana]|nr:hypothetical protein QOZ80_5AG0389430 [Eleusine coracana subsp. coracana]
MISGQSLHMKLAEGEASYGRNSKVQNAQQNRMKPFIENAVTSLMESADDVPSSVVIADLGCSFGPNALGLVSTAVSAISQHCSLRKQAEPEICVLLNDLPSNDFNSVAKSLVALQQSSPSSAALLTGIVPGSFYKRLFTSNSLNLVLSSNSLHWLSEPPEILKSNGIPMYDNDEGLRRTRRPLVVQACAQQFRKDFTVFLGLRAKELVPGGRMVVSLLGSCASRCIEPWDTITVPLNDMASRGFIRREMVDSF